MINLYPLASKQIAQYSESVNNKTNHRELPSHISGSLEKSILTASLPTINRKWF
jgi:hypothetical protein